MRGFRAIGSIAATLPLLTLALMAVGVPAAGSSVPAAVTFSGVTGYVYGDTNGYAPTVPLSGVTVTALDDCTSLLSMSCTTVNSTTTDLEGFFGMNLTAGSGYYLSVSPEHTPAADAPDGFGGATQSFTAPVSSPLPVDVYPFVPYGNATFVLPAYNCMAAYLNNYAENGPGCQSPVLSWTQDGAYYVNVTDNLTFYSFINGTTAHIADWTPLYQTFPDYAMIPNELFMTQDGSYIYGWGTLSSSSTVLTAEAVNITTHRVFMYNFTEADTSGAASDGQVQMTGWDGNDSQLTLIANGGAVYDHDIWGTGETEVALLPFFEANNVYWEPNLNGYVNVEAGGNDGDYVQELQLTGPSTSSTDYTLEQTYLEQWSVAGIVVNGVNGVSFNVTDHELLVGAENSGLVYSVAGDGTLSSLLLVTNPVQGSVCDCVTPETSSEGDRPVLVTSGPQLGHNYEGFDNNSWLVDMTLGHIGYYSTNVSPYVFNPRAPASWGNVHSWIPWFQEGQFFNDSYMISSQSYACDVAYPAPCTINGGDGAAVGTIWWFWKLGLPELPFPADARSADATAPGPTDVTSVSTTSTTATLNWIPPSGGFVLNYTVAWGTTPGEPTNFASVFGSATSYTISGLAPNTTYYFTVEAWNLHYHGQSAGVSTFDTFLPLVLSGVTVFPSAAGPPTDHGVDVGQTLGFTVTASGGVSPYTWSWSGLPSSCTGTTTAVVECVPSTPGNYSVVVTVSDSVGQLVKSPALTVTVFALPVVTMSVTPLSVVLGNSVTFTGTVSGGAGGFLYTWSGLPPGCAAPSGLSSARPWTWTCAPSATGTYGVVVIVKDQDGGTGSANISLTVTATSSGASATEEYEALGAIIGAAVVIAAVAVVLVNRRRKRRGVKNGGAGSGNATPPPSPPPS